MSGSLALPVVPPAHGPKEDLTEPVGLRISKTLLKRLRAVAEATGRSTSDVMRYLMVAGLEAYENEQRGKK